MYSSRSRSLVDAVYDWSRVDSLPRAYDWIRSELNAERVTAEQLVRDAARFANQGTVRRIGSLLEAVGIDEKLLKRLRRKLRSAKSTVAFVPDASRRGPVDSNWGVIINEPNDQPIGRLHEDPILFRELVSFTAAHTGFLPRLIEKDYFCTLVLSYLCGVCDELVFKGGTCLSKHTRNFIASAKIWTSVSPCQLMPHDQLGEAMSRPLNTR